MDKTKDGHKFRPMDTGIFSGRVFGKHLARFFLLRPECFHKSNPKRDILELKSMDSTMR